MSISLTVCSYPRPTKITIERESVPNQFWVRLTYCGSQIDLFLDGEAFQQLTERCNAALEADAMKAMVTQ